MKKSFSWAILILLVAIPIISWILPSDFYDDDTIVCLSQSLLDFECMWCGILNGMQQLHHLNFEDAIFYNYFSPVAYLILLYVWYKQLGKSLINLGFVNKWRLIGKTLEASA